MSRQANARPAEAGFVEAVLEIQRHVSAGAPREDTYQSIVNEGVQLLSADSGALRL